MWGKWNVSSYVIPERWRAQALLGRQATYPGSYKRFPQDKGSRIITLINQGRALDSGNFRDDVRGHA